MIESINSPNHIPISIQFPSFAPSLQTSPQIKKSGQSSTFQSLNSPQVHKISIHLPEELLEDKQQQLNNNNNNGNNYFRNIQANTHVLQQKYVQKQMNKKRKQQQPKYYKNQNYHQNYNDYNNNVNKQENNDNNSTNNIKVYCRMREPTKSEDCLKYDSTMIDDGQNCYSFDYVFNKNISQKQVYQRVTLRHINDFFMGKNSTIFAYGQTGSGKTHTMFGNMNKTNQYGLIPRALSQIFRRDLSDNTITCSMLQIYNQKLYDLFNPLTNSYSEIKLKQVNQSIYLEGLQQILVENKDQLLDLIKVGHRGRKIASTMTNDVSSRSHTVLFVYRNFKCKGQEYRSKLCFIDLAGSEKIKKSGAKGQTLEQTKKINLSLSCLGNVIHALTNGSDHIPYRNSKLTRILKDSLATQTNTSIITTCSLQKSDHNETVSTIKFAVRAKKIKNKKKLSNQQVPLEQKFYLLKRQLEQTKKQLAHYKQYQKQGKLVGSGYSITDNVQLAWSQSIKQQQVPQKQKQQNKNFAKKLLKPPMEKQKQKQRKNRKSEQLDNNQIAEQSFSFIPVRSLQISKGMSSRININQQQQ